MDDKEDFDDDGRITYYYSRKERLKRASQEVRDINNPSKRRKAGIFRALTATLSLRILFFSIILFCIIVFLLSRFMRPEPVMVLANNIVAVSAVTAGDRSYITIKKTAGQHNVSGAVYTGIAGVVVSLPGESSAVYVEYVYFSAEQEEVFQFTVPFSGNKLLVLIEAEAEQLVFEITPQR